MINSLLDLLKSPWFYSSPSPWSLTVYAILAYYGGRVILSTGAKYRRWPRFFSFLDALFIVVLVVLIQDTLWLVINTARWLPEYGHRMNSYYWLRFPQNIAAMYFVFISIKDKFKLYFDISSRSYLSVFLVYAVMLAFHFLTSPDPSYTDWTYGIRFLQDIDFRILWGFITGHVVGKAFIAWMYFAALAPLFEVRDLIRKAAD